MSVSDVVRPLEWTNYGPPQDWNRHSATFGSKSSAESNVRGSQVSRMSTHGLFRRVRVREDWAVLFRPSRPSSSGEDIIFPAGTILAIREKRTICTRSMSYNRPSANKRIPPDITSDGGRIGHATRQSTIPYLGSPSPVRRTSTDTEYLRRQTVPLLRNVCIAEISFGSRRAIRS